MVGGQESGGTWESKRAQIVSILESVSNDPGTPRNIRRIAKSAADTLFDEKYSPAVRVANAIDKIEEVLQDPNMPQFTRVQLWNAISLLETIRSVE